MKKLLTVTAILSTLTSYAQTPQQPPQPLPQQPQPTPYRPAPAPQLPVSQCPQPNVLLAKDFIGLTGETVTQSYSRQGTSEIPTEAQFAGSLKANTYKVFNERYCMPRVFNYEQEACDKLNPDHALGRGNDILRSLFDLKVTLLRRADMFARSVRFGAGTPEANRASTATEVVKNLTRIASVAGIPRSWNEFSDMLKQVVTEGFITQAEFDDIAVVNALVNRRNLGFEALAGVQYIEGRGNGRLGKMFDLSLSPQHRAAVIRTTLDGVNPNAAQGLAKTFIDFAASNGIPSTWNQLVLMLRDSVVKNAISNLEFKNITDDLEIQNRKNLGFDIDYLGCRMERRQFPFNVVEENRKNEFNDVRSANFQIQVSNAPLLSSESESVQVQFHSLDGLRVYPSESYNSYSVDMSTQGDVQVYKLTGARKRITPRNAIVAVVDHKGNKVNVRLQNTEFNPKVGGKVIVEVNFYEKIVLLKDKHLGTKTYELTDGNMTSFTPNMQMKKGSRPAYVEVKMKYVGSAYFNENNSEMKEFKE